MAWGAGGGGAGLYEPARPSSERWRRVAGGWECYALPTPAIGGGAPWGAVVEGTPFIRVPYRALFGGAHPATDPQAFEWIWPDSRLQEIYAHVAERDIGNPWHKTEAGEYVRA